MCAGFTPCFSPCCYTYWEPDSGVASGLRWLVMPLRFGTDVATELGAESACGCSAHMRSSSLLVLVVALAAARQLTALQQQQHKPKVVVSLRKWWSTVQNLLKSRKPTSRLPDEQHDVHTLQKVAVDTAGGEQQAD